MRESSHPELGPMSWRIALLCFVTALAGPAARPNATKSPPDPGERAIAWGNPVEGLQAGIRLMTGSDTVAAGDLVRFHLVVRNVTDHPIDITHYPVQKRFGWRAAAR